MTIPASSVPAAMNALLTGLTALLTPDPETDGLLVCMGEPGTYQPMDIVYLGAVHQTYSAESVVGSGGSNWLREDYQVHICVSIYRGGDDASIASLVMTRATFLVNQIAAFVRSDPSLGGIVHRARPAQVSFEPTLDTEHLGRRVDAEISIDVMNVPTI